MIRREFAFEILNTTGETGQATRLACLDELLHERGVETSELFAKSLAGS
jgi:hypothetical protein